MIIQGDFFQITPSNNTSNFFDLKLLHKIGGKNPREEYQDEGYGMTLETAIKKCINYALNQKFDVLTLQEYLTEYRKIKEEIGLILNQ